MNEKEKSVILKGRTLVNILNYNNITISGNATYAKEGNRLTITSNAVSSYAMLQFHVKDMLKNTKYIVFHKNVKSSNLPTSGTTIRCYGYYKNGNKTVGFSSGYQGGDYQIIDLTNEKLDYDTITLRVHASTEPATANTLTVEDLMMIEYQDGMENWNISYFEGLNSVVAPKFESVGKNLCPINNYETEVWEYASGYQGFNRVIVKNIPVDELKEYKLSYVKSMDDDVPTSIGNIAIQYSDVEVPTSGYNDHNSVYTWCQEHKGQKFAHLTIPNIGALSSTTDYRGKQLTLSNIQIEEGSIATTYEPYQSNTLSTPSDLTLRAVGNVADELDCKSGILTKNCDAISITSYLTNSQPWGTTTMRFNNSNVGLGNDILADNFPIIDTNLDKEVEGCCMENGTLRFVLKGKTHDEAKARAQELATTFIVASRIPQTQQVTIALTDQDNQPIERMKLFANGRIYTSSSTLDPILEMKGITYNNKLDIKATNGTYTTNSTTLDSIVLDGIICRDGTIVRDSYDVESGLYTKRVFRFTIDEEFVEKYRNKFVVNGTTDTTFSMRMGVVANCGFPNITKTNKENASNIPVTGKQNAISLGYNNVYIQILKEEVSSYDVDGILEWIKRNGAIEVAYAMDEPQIIHMQPNMNPYVSTRPYQGEINSQGNALESSFLDYTQEESILSPKPLGDGDVLRWEQGSQCYVYENDKDYIPLTDYNQKVGTVLDLEDDEQFVENLDGGEIVVDVPFKEKAVYERELVSYEDTVIYPTNASADPDGKVEVDYICGATWQNPDDLSDIQHLGTLREDGQYDVTIRRSGDDEIRFMDGTTHLSLDHEGLNPSEFELTYYNKDGVEVGKYGDTRHMLENTLVDGKLETGMVYGETLVNLLDPNELKGSTHTVEDNIVTINGNGANYTLEVTFPKIATEPNKVYTLCNCGLTDNTTSAGGNYLVTYRVTEFNGTTYKREKQINNGSMVITIGAETTNVVVSFFVRSANGEAKFTMPMLVEGDYTSYPMDIPYFEGVNSTVVNGFTTTGKNLLHTGIKDYEHHGITVNYLGNQTYLLDGANSAGGDWFLMGGQYDYDTYIKVRQNTDYTVKLFIESGYCSMDIETGASVATRLSNEDGTQVKWTGGQFNTSECTRLGGIRFAQSVVGKLEFRDCVIKVMVSEGSDCPTEFEPYHSIQYTLPSPITLNKVGDVVDTFDVVSGVETRNHVSVKFDGSEDENWVVRFDTYGSARNKIYGAFINNMYQSGNNTYTDLFVTNYKSTQVFIDNFIGTEKGQWGVYLVGNEQEVRLITPTGTTTEQLKEYLQANPLEIVVKAKTPQKIQHTLIPSTVEMMQEPTFILPQPLRSVPNGICDRLYWDENKGHYCIEKRIEEVYADGSQTYKHRNNGDGSTTVSYQLGVKNKSLFDISRGYCYPMPRSQSSTDGVEGWGLDSGNPNIFLEIKRNKLSEVNVNGFVQWITENPQTVIYPSTTSEIINLPHLNRKLELPTCPDKLPVGYKAVHPKMNPQIGLTIPYKQLNPPSQPQNLDFQMNKEDYVLTWNDVKEARQYNVILNDNVIATTKVPFYNTGEEIHGYILVEAQNEIADNLSKELYVKTVPKAPAQLTVAHNGLTDNYDFEISFIKSTSSLADRYTVQYRVDGGEWIIQDIPADEVDANVKVLWRFSVFEIKNQIEVWATATNDMGTNDILPLSTYYMTPTPQWTYRINSREVFLRWVDESPYDTQYKLRYQYKSDGIYRYAHFEGDKEEIGQLYEAVVALAEDDEVTLELCVISDRENLYCKPIKASKALDPNILPPKNFNYRWLSRGLIEFYWEDVYDVDLEYEAIVEHRLSGEISWIEDRRVFSATDTEGTGTVYRLQYQMEDLEEIRVKVRMKWAMNETEWSESLTTVFIPVEGNPPQWIRRTQTQEGLLVEWEAQEYIDSYHVYVKGDGVELQHLETKDNFIYVDIDYSNPIDIEIYEVSRFTGGIEAEPSDSMRFIPHQNKQQMINNIYHPDSLKYEIEVDTVQKAQKASYQINDINTTPDVRTREAMDISISSPFIITYHPLEVDVHQKGVKSYGVAETHIKTLDVKTRETVEVLTFERITDKYGMDFTVYTPFASKYPVNLEINQVRIVCLGDSLTSGHPLYWAESGTGDVTASYPYQLAKRLKNQYEVINKGYGSDTTDRCLARFDKDVLAYSPQYCLYQCGTNDLYWD